MTAHDILLERIQEISQDLDSTQALIDEARIAIPDNAEFQAQLDRDQEAVINDRMFVLRMTMALRDSKQ